MEAATRKWAAERSSGERGGSEVRAWQTNCEWEEERALEWQVGVQKRVWCEHDGHGRIVEDVLRFL